MDNNLKLFEELGIQKDIVDQYSEVSLTNEQSVLVKDLVLKMSFDNNIYPQIREIFQREYELEEQGKIVFLQFISFKKDLLYLLFNSELQNDFIDLDIIIYALEALINKGNFQITKQEVYQICERVYAFPIDTSEIYSVLVKMIKNTPNLTEEILTNYKLAPNKQIVPLVIYLLQSEEEIKEFISELNDEYYINKLFIVRACEKLRKNERAFVIDLINNKLSKLSSPEFDKLELLNPYILLLFDLFIDDENIVIMHEIKRIINEFEDWDPVGLLMIIYRRNPKMLPALASLLFMVVNKLPSNEHGLDHLLDSLFSQLPASELSKYYLSILSVMKDETGKQIFNKLQENIEVYFDGLLNSILEADEHDKIALNLLKNLLNNKTVDMKMIDEQYYLYLLRCFHCFIIEADFICRVAIEIYLNSMTKKMQDNIYEYIVTSISENYFTVLKELVLKIDDPALHPLTTYLKEKDELMNLALRNPDFKPSFKRMGQYYEKLADQNRKIQEDAREASVFRDLFQSQTILYGHKVRSYYQVKTGELHEQENIMNKMEYRIPIPTRFTYDRLFYQSELLTISKGFIK